MKHGTYTAKVLTHDGVSTKEIPARISDDGVFAIQRDDRPWCDQPWTVAHIPSGLVASPEPFAKLRQAKRFIDLISPLADWKGLYVDDNRHLPYGSPLPGLMRQAANDARKV